MIYLFFYILKNGSQTYTNAHSALSTLDLMEVTRNVKTDWCDRDYVEPTTPVHEKVHNFSQKFSQSQPCPTLLA